MAIPFRNPEPGYAVNTRSEKYSLGRLFTERKIPQSEPGKVLLATWNIANLGVQSRPPSSLSVIAYLLRRFDLIAVQEVNDNFNDFTEIVRMMGRGFHYVMTDTAGNDERLAFIYRTSRVSTGNLFGELAFTSHQYPKLTVEVNWSYRRKPRVEIFPNFEFVPFDRNPYIGSFRAGALTLILANTHLYFGEEEDSNRSDERYKYARRVLEVHALSRWANRRLNDANTYDGDIVLLGDMNVPTMSDDEDTYRELVRYGWQTVEYPSRTGGSNLGNDKTYDQMVFAPGTIGTRVLDNGVFDFDNAVLKAKWREIAARETRTSKRVKAFNAYVRFHYSDHRPLWLQLDVS